MSNRPVLNPDAYLAIQDMGFNVIDVLRIFGEEVWENNNELSEVYSLPETTDAFIELMLNQSRRILTIHDSAESQEGEVIP